MLNSRCLQSYKAVISYDSKVLNSFFEEEKLLKIYFVAQEIWTKSAKKVEYDDSSLNCLVTTKALIYRSHTRKGLTHYMYD